MSLTPLSRFAKDISDDIHSIHASLLRDSDPIAAHVAERIRLWQQASTEELKAEFPYALYEQQLSDWKIRNQHPPVSCAELAEAVTEYSAFCRAAKLPANQFFWQRELASATASQKTPDR